MSDEATAVATEAPASTGSDTSSTPARSEAGNQGDFFGHRSTSVDLTKPQPQATKAEAPAKPDKPEASDGQAGDSKSNAKDGAKPDKAKAPEQKPTLAVNEQHAQMLRNQGIDPATLANDPAALNKLLDNYANMHSAFTKKAQMEKTEQATSAAKAALPPAGGATQTEEPNGPIAEFEAAWNYSIQPYLAAQGAKDMTELLDKNPQLYAYLNSEYMKGSMKALREDIAWQSTTAAQKMDAEKERVQHYNTLKEAESHMLANLTEAKKTNPEIERMFKDHGVEDFLKHLEDSYAIPRTFLLSDQRWMGFFTKAAAANEALKNMPDHDKKVIADHMKEIGRASCRERVSHIV
jgi:hypothetical protein